MKFLDVTATWVAMTYYQVNSLGTLPHSRSVLQTNTEATMTSQRASFFPSETNIFVVEFRYYPAPKSNPICKNQPNQSMMFLLGFHVKFPGLFLKKSSLPLHANSRFFPSSAHPKAGSLLQHPQNDILFCRYIMTFKDCQCQERVQFLCCFPTLRMIMIRKRTQKICHIFLEMFGCQVKLSRTHWHFQITPITPINN